MATPRAPADGQARRRARTHAALVTAGLELLTQGRTSASIDEITKRAGVGFGSFFNHFDSKEDMFAEAVFQVLDAYVTWLRAATAGLTDPAEVFAVSFRMTGRLAGEQAQLFAPLLSRGTEVLLVERGLRDAALSDICAGVQQGRFADEDPEVLLVSVGGVLLGLLRLLTAEPDRDAAATTDVVTERVLCLLGLPSDEARALVAQPLPATPQVREWSSPEER